MTGRARHTSPCKAKLNMLGVAYETNYNGWAENEMMLLLRSRLTFSMITSGYLPNGIHTQQTYELF
jgi:hypothetical protein